MTFELRQAAAGGRVPDAGGLVPRTRDEARAVLGEGDRGDVFQMTFGSIRGIGESGIPDPYRAVVGAGYEMRAIGGEANGSDDVGMASERVDTFSSTRIPDSDGHVARG